MEKEGIAYFSSKVALGTEGVASFEEVSSLGLTEYENKLLEVCKTELKANINKGVEFGKK